MYGWFFFNHLQALPKSEEPPAILWRPKLYS